MHLMKFTAVAMALSLASAVGLGVDQRGFVAPASATAPTATIPQVPLTAASIRTWIGSYPTVKPQTDAVARKYKIQGNTAGADQGWGPGRPPPPRGPN
jgi:hypothetical protein